ncbi:F-box/FBD/LRR-repeat protein At1g13570-like [Solanum dulcamara]|uniref:F-box/FBD/LRR-repeat protein At1g13570-like n=1 Tax=Solanum dulcamara TaxID=45834 RepID=UPI0024868730|nr:F-box/FBD/LRR-repeat protein At1g13570-like [Solanum dulcamara]
MRNQKNKNSHTTWIGDKLPECLIHKIFSCLSYEEAANSSLLSKTWLEAWSTQPNLKFKVEYGKGNNNNRKRMDKIMERYRERKSPIDKFALYISSSTYHHVLAFPRIDKWLDIALQNGVKDVVCKVSVPSYPFPISTFLASKSLRELVLTGCDIMSLSLSTSTSDQLVKCHSLRRLSLCDVRLDDNILQTLVNCCPLLVDLKIQNCSLLTKIELRNLENIKSVYITTSYIDHISSVEIQAPTLEHLSYFGSCIAFDIIECQNLKSLELSDMAISEGFLECLISTSQNLERLILYFVSGELHERFNICRSQSLKVLAIQDCEDIGEIDASNLVSLEIVGSEIPELNIAKVSNQLKNSQIDLRCYNNLINAEWFCKLRIFLSNLTTWSQVSLHFDDCNEINMKDLQLHHSIAIPQVFVLNVDMRFINDVKSCPNFVDALLWSCHPRRLNLFSTIETITCFMDRLMYMKNSSHSTYDGSALCHSQLKEVKAYKFISEHEHVEVDRQELAMMTQIEMDAIFFLLDR